MRSHGPLFLAASVALGAFAACGGGAKTPPRIVTVPSASASSSAGTLSAPPSGLPPMAVMPPPGVLGSKKAKMRRDGALYECGGGSKLAAKDPADQVKRVGESCAAASKMKPVGAPFRGTDGDGEPHREHKFSASANKCYRVYFATDESVKDAVLLLRDSAGDVIAESPGAALPEDGVICFSVSDEVTLMVAVGAGKGSYVAQVWSD